MNLNGGLMKEDLNIKGMMKNKKLAKWISFNQFYNFKRILSYKCEMREKIIQLRVYCYSIKQNIDHKILFGIEISSFAMYT